MNRGHFSNLVRKLTDVRGNSNTFKAHYPLSLKAEVGEYLAQHGGACLLADKSGVTKSLLYKWARDYREGNYTMDKAISITRKLEGIDHIRAMSFQLHSEIQLGETVLKEKKEKLAKLERFLSTYEELLGGSL